MCIRRIYKVFCCISLIYVYTKSGTKFDQMKENKLFKLQYVIFFVILNIFV